MGRYRHEQRLQFIQTNRSLIENLSALLLFNGRNNRLNELFICRISENFEFLFSLHSFQVSIKQRTRRINANIVAVQASVDKEHNLSIP